MATTIVPPGMQKATNPGADNNTYVVEPGASLTVAGGLGPGSVIIDIGGTVLFGTPAGQTDSGIVTVLDAGNLVFAGLQFISPAAAERIRIDGTSTLGIANTTAGLAGAPTTKFNWVTNLDGFNPTDPLAGSFNITFAGQPTFGLDVGLLGSTNLFRPPWSFSQPVGGAGIFSPTATVAMGIPSTPNAPS